MTASIIRQFTDATTLSGGETIALTDPIVGPKKLVSVSFNWGAGAAPTTSENITIIIDSNNGAAYDVPLRTMDPSTFEGGVYDWIWSPEGDQGVIADNDHIAIAYANTDDLAIGVTLVMEEV